MSSTLGGPGDFVIADTALCELVAISRAITRRTVLTRTATLGAVAAGGVLVVSCTTGDSGKKRQQQIDQLLPLLSDARADEAAARAAIATTPDRAAALGVIADERRTHADALSKELTTIDADRGASAASSAAPTPTSPPAVDALRDQLGRSAKRAGDLAVSLNGFRAGLAGSIAASVTTQVRVQLA